MLAVVTGASGHLGANLIRALKERGYQVRALVYKDARALEGINLERVSGDILNLESLIKAFKSVDIVYHLAARISIVNWDYKQVDLLNIKGVQNVVDACIYAGVKRLVHTSSFHAHLQKPLDKILDETRPLINSDNYPGYNRSKAKGERIVQAAIIKGMDAIVITPAGMIGPYDFKPSLFGITLIKMAQGKIPVIVNAGLDWVDTRDVAEGMINAGEHAQAGEKYILSGHWVNLKDIAQQVCQISGTKLPILTLPMWAAKPSASFVSTIDRIRGKRSLFTEISMKELESNKNLSHAKASKDLGYEPRPLENTIIDTIKWYQNNGFINSDLKKINQ